MSASCRRRRCLECNGLFMPDCRNRTRQRYCSSPACRLASKKASQARWCAKPANRDYFRGPANTERNRLWRAAHPGYWKRHQRSRTQQDPSTSELVESQSVEGYLASSSDPGTQQDPSRMQLIVFLGLIAQLSASTQQDTIDASLRRLHALGREVFARAPDGQGLATTLLPLCPNGP